MSDDSIERQAFFDSSFQPLRHFLLFRTTSTFSSPIFPCFNLRRHLISEFKSKIRAISQRALIPTHKPPLLRHHLNQKDQSSQGARDHNHGSNHAASSRRSPEHFPTAAVATISLVKSLPDPVSQPSVITTKQRQHAQAGLASITLGFPVAAARERSSLCPCRAAPKRVSVARAPRASLPRKRRSPVLCS